MALSIAQARGTGPSRISNNPDYRPYRKMPSETQRLKASAKEKESSSSNQVKCQAGYVKYMGRCISQEKKNKMSNVREAKNKTTIDKANKRFYSV